MASSIITLDDIRPLLPGVGDEQLAIYIEDALAYAGQIIGYDLAKLTIEQQKLAKAVLRRAIVRNATAPNAGIASRSESILGSSYSETLDTRATMWGWFTKREEEQLKTLVVAKSRKAFAIELGRGVDARQMDIT